MNEEKRDYQVRVMKECLSDACRALPRGYGDENARILMAIAFFRLRTGRKAGG